MWKKKILYYDSLGWGGKKYLNGALNWLQDEAASRKGISLAAMTPVDETWKLVDVPRSDQPHQLDSPMRDCAVFTCTNANCIADDIPITLTLYSQADIFEHVLRRNIGTDILRGHFTYPLFD
jgi:Ulp1 family protease